MKQKVAVIYGGTNTEHEVSLVSARSVIENLNKDKYQVVRVLIEKDGSWVIEGKKQNSPPDWKSYDVAFPVLHGPYGEDGTIQGMLEMAGIPYVGCGVLASAVCMDKVVQKDICKLYKMPVTKYFWLTQDLWTKNKGDLIKTAHESLDYPVFTKPANQGSSIGITKARNINELEESIEHALELDHKIIIEEAVPDAREIECSVLGNDEPESSVLGEIIPSGEFYDYNAKYVDGESQEIIPAKLEDNLTSQIKSTAEEAYKLLGCEGLARIDFLVEGNTTRYYLNEINTMPGFTSISMYPKLWEASGVSYDSLLDKLIDLAVDRHENKSGIKLSYSPKKNWHEE